MVTNMKILVFSDSHGRLGAMVDAIERERPQRVFFLGDHYRDGQELAGAYPDLPMELVKGNCDWDQAPDELLVEAGGVRFLLTHGHRYGHTHEGLNMPDRGVLLFNPGTAGGIQNRVGYGVIVAADGKFRADLR